MVIAYYIFIVKSMTRHRRHKSSTGWCLSNKKLDQNYGVGIIAGSFYKYKCLEICKSLRGVDVTGCEYDKEHETCSYHTQPISHGNGNGNHICWRFKGKGRIINKKEIEATSKSKYN